MRSIFFKLLLCAAVALLPWRHTFAADHAGSAFPLEELKFIDPAPQLTGHPAIVEFWATWCGPCVGLIPHLNELHDQYKNRGLLIIGVSLDFDKRDIAPFRAKNPINYTVAFDEDQKLSAKLGVEAIPYAFLVNKNGKIVWEGLSSALKKDQLDGLVK